MHDDFKSKDESYDSQAKKLGHFVSSPDLSFRLNNRVG